jgi:hypothetical protein
LEILEALQIGANRLPWPSLHKIELQFLGFLKDTAPQGECKKFLPKISMET